MNVFAGLYVSYNTGGLRIVSFKVFKNQLLAVVGVAVAAKMGTGVVGANVATNDTLTFGAGEILLWWL